MSTEWEDRARRAHERRERLEAFGPNAVGLFVEAKTGLFVVDPEDSSVSAQLLQCGEYAPDEIGLVSRFIRGGDVIVVGSHIGAHVVVLSRISKRLVAIEANPRTFKLLSANIRLNELKNVEAYNVAVGAGGGTIPFVLNRENSGGSKRMPTAKHMHYFYDDPEVIEVDMVALDDLINRREFDIILMDIEGSEYFALKGMPELLERAGAVAIEFLPHHLVDVSGVTPEQFVEPLIEFFEWLYIPQGNLIIPKEQIVHKMRQMYDAGEGHDLIVFSKERPVDASFLGSNLCATGL